MTLIHVANTSTMSFFLNGSSLGVAFSNLERNFEFGGYAPACSMDGGESVWFNFGPSFQYPPTSSPPRPPPPLSSSSAALSSSSSSVFTFCPLSDFCFPLVPTPPTLPLVRILSIDVQARTATVKNVLDKDNASDAIFHVPLCDIAPVDWPWSQWLPGAQRSEIDSRLIHHIAITTLRSWLVSSPASLMSHVLIRDQAQLLTLTSIGQPIDSSFLEWPCPSHIIADETYDWVLCHMQAQLARARPMMTTTTMAAAAISALQPMVIEASRHPLSLRLVQVSANVNSCLKMIRQYIVDVESHLDKGQTRLALTLLQRITDVVLERTNRESGDHLQRCRTSLDKTYQSIRTAADTAAASAVHDPFHAETLNMNLESLIHMELAYRRNPRAQLEKIIDLKRALEAFEKHVAPRSVVPIETVRGKRVGTIHSHPMTMMISFSIMTDLSIYLYIYDERMSISRQYSCTCS
jgi:hypothetical protein